MKKAFTIIEVSILLIIFLIVALLVAPLSIDDTVEAKNISKWRNVQQDFSNIFNSMNAQNFDDVSIPEQFKLIIADEIKLSIEPYKIVYLNGTFPSNNHRFTDYMQTNGNATLAYKYFDKPENDIIGVLMFDVNGASGPNIWGKDVFGLNLYKDKFEPFCKNETLEYQKQDCSKSGTGICCSNYYLSGGRF